MTADSVPASTQLVVHLLPRDMSRGAQSYARALVDRLDSDEERHVVVTLFSSPEGLARPDFELGVPQGRMRQVGFDPRAMARLRRLLRGLRPRLVVAHGGESAKYAAASMPRRLPLVYLIIGSAHERLSSRTRSFLYRRYLRRADRLIAVSQTLADEVVEIHRVPQSKVEVIPNGRDSTVFVPNPGHARGKSPRVVFIGNLDEAKRPALFVDVISEVRRRGGELEALIVGSGPREAELKHRASRENVTMLGVRDDVPRLLGRSDILVFTGRPPEGMPGVLIEAGLCGLPVVTTRVPGAQDVVLDGSTGFVVDILDQRGLADSLERLVADAGLRVSMGLRARDRCVSRFSLDATIRDWQRVLATFPKMTHQIDE